jgi:hypothetical protein
VVFGGAGFGIEPEMRYAVADFLIRTRSAAPIVPPRQPPR